MAKGGKGGIKLAPLMTEIKVDIQNFKTDMEKAASIGKSEAEKISKDLEGTAKAGEKLSKVGDVLTLGVTAPLLAAGAALGKFAIDSENSLGILQGQLGTTAEETERLQEIARNVYENGYGDSIDDCIADLSLLRQNVRESTTWTDEMTQSTLEQISTITTLFDTNADEVTRTVQVMKSSGLIENVSEGLDIITYGFQNGANYSGEMLDTLREYSPQFVKLGLDADSAMQLMIQGAENGAFNLDKIGDALKELSIRVVDGSDTTVQGFEAMGLSADEMAQKFAAGGDSAQQAFQETLNGLASIEDPVQRNIAGVNLFGTMWEDLGETVILSLADVEGGLEGVEGATERAGEGLNNTFSARATSLARELKDSLLPLGEALLDIGEDILPDVKEGIEDFSDMMENMDSETAKNVITFGALAAAAGPVIKTISGGISVYETLSKKIGGVSKALSAFGTSQAAAAAAAGTTTTAVGASGLTGSMVGLLGTCAPIAAGAALVGTGIYAIHESAQLAGRSVNEASDDMSLMEKALATLSGTEIHTREELEELGLVTKDYGDTLSSEFVDAMETARGKVADFNAYLTEVNIDGIVTTEESNAVVQRVEDMCDSVIQTIQERKDEAQSNLRELFMAEDGVIDESEQQVLDSLGSSYDEQLQIVQQHVDAINQIKQEAAAQNDQLNAEQIEALGQHYEQLAQLELEASAQTQEELLAAKKDFQDQIVRMNADQASELLQQKAKERDDEMQIISQKYDEGISQLEAYMEMADETQKAGYQEQIDALEKAKQEALDKEQDKYDQYYEMALESNKNLEDAINRYTGNVLTNQDKMCQDNLDTMRSMYKEMGSITESGCYEMWDAQNQHYSRVAVKVDETTGEIVGAYDLTTGMVAGYCESMGQDAEKMANSQSASFQQIISAEGAYVDYTTGSVMLANGQTIASLDDLKQHTDGTREGIVNINGTPYNIKVDSDGTISELNEVSAAADQATKKRTLKIDVSVAGSSLGSSLGSAISSAVASYRYNGLDNVPYDGYYAVLHKGERVLTAEENKIYSQDPGIDYGKMEKCMRSAVRELTLSIGSREFGRMIDNRLRERGILS